MSLQVNRSYIEELKAKDYRIEFQNMVLGISFEFMSITQENFDEKVNDLLKNIGSFFNVDRTYLFSINHQNDTMTYSNEWCNTGIAPEVGTIDEIPLDVFPWWLDQLRRENLVYIEDVNIMPAEAKTVKEQLTRQGVKSLISVPIMIDEKIHAFIGIDSVKSTKKWTNEKIDLLYIMAKILASGIIRINYDKKIDYMAYHDPLTGLPNRSLLIDRVTQGVSRAYRQDTLISLMFIDLDGFKMINDTLGHDQGDELLKQVSTRLLTLSTKHDTVYRLGGDEFILYLSDYQDVDKPDHFSAKLIDTFNNPFTLKGQEFFITVSVGISQYPKDGDDVYTLLQNADIAMYEAKSLGKNQYQKCSTDLINSTQEKVSITNKLYRAIEQDEMMLYYQPKVNGISGEILGVEVLLRWDHPEIGFIPPCKFIPLAEQTRLILPIGYWVLQTACAQLKSWQEKGYNSFKISVNFSVYQLMHPSIVEQIEEVLAYYSLDASCLVMEVTESEAMVMNSKIKDTLKRIVNLGVSLSIDDFGKEYSSLSRLRELPVEKVKIDMSFIQGIGISNKDEMIIKAIISLAANLGFTTVAEGVETKEQKDFLNKNNCNELQGYYFYKPMPAHEMEKVLFNLS